MKHVKKLGFVAVAVAALTALMGASTASATVLCKTTPIANSAGTPKATCPEGWAYAAGTEIHAIQDPEQHTTLTDREGNKVVTCSKTTGKGKTSNEGNATETVKANIETLSFEKCTSPFLGGTACTMTAVLGGTLEVHWIAHTENGTLTSSGATVTTLCASIFGPIHCAYVTENIDLGVLTGGSPATIDIESAPLVEEITSPLCPEGPKWDAKYEITEPRPLYVASET
jgi:hypothetical protein